MVKIEDGNDPSGEDILEEAEAIVEEAAEKIAAEKVETSGCSDQEAQGDAHEASDADVEGDVAEPTLEDQLAAAREQEAEWKDKFMRLHAEWDTYRRRTSEQREEEKARATEGLVESLIPILDDFERSIEYATANGSDNLLEGVQQVHAKLVDVLTKGGVEVIDPKGMAYDALEAQAVSTIEDASVPDETVHEVYQKGYKMGRKVLRAAMVVVAVGGPKREEEAAASDGE